MKEGANKFCRFFEVMLMISTKQNDTFLLFCCNAFMTHNWKYNSNILIILRFMNIFAIIINVAHFNCWQDYSRSLIFQPLIIISKAFSTSVHIFCPVRLSSKFSFISLYIKENIDTLFWNYNSFISRTCRIINLYVIEYDKFAEYHKCITKHRHCIIKFLSKQ